MAASLFVASLDHIGPLARSVDDLARVYDALQGVDPADHFQAARSIEPVADKLGQTVNLRCAVLGGFFDSWCDDDAKTAVATVAHRLEALECITLPEAELARSAAFLLSAAEGETIIYLLCANMLNTSNSIPASAF